MVHGKGGLLRFLALDLLSRWPKVFTFYAESLGCWNCYSIKYSQPDIMVLVKYPKNILHKVSCIITREIVIIIQLKTS